MFDVFVVPMGEQCRHDHVRTRKPS